MTTGSISRAFPLLMRGRARAGLVSTIMLTVRLAPWLYYRFDLPADVGVRTTWSNN